MAKAKTPPKSFFGSSRMSEHVFNVIAVSLLDEVDVVPEVGPNALAHLKRDLGETRHIKLSPCPTTCRNRMKFIP